MGRYRIDLAQTDDDAPLRALMAATPMPGGISLCFAREPRYLDAAVVEGRFRQTLVLRDATSGLIVGAGSRAVMSRFVNGQPAPIGYLSNLRIEPQNRGTMQLARGYRYFRELHADRRTAIYLTTIAEDNTPALRLLTSGRAGLPMYHDAGRFHTMVLPLSSRRRSTPGCHGQRSPKGAVVRAGMSACGSGPSLPTSGGTVDSGSLRSPPPTVAPDGITVRPASADDLPHVLAFLRAHGPSRQFFPCYEADDFTHPTGLLRDLRPEQILLAFRDDQLIGTLAGWNQQLFRQQIVHSYSGALRWSRQLYNALAAVRGAPSLPNPGQPLRSIVAALPVVRDDRPEVFDALVDALIARLAGTGCDYLYLGLHERDPLWPALQNRRGRLYTTRLHLVAWDDGLSAIRQLDDRPPYLELGSL